MAVNRAALRAVTARVPSSWPYSQPRRRVTPCDQASLERGGQGLCADNVHYVKLKIRKEPRGACSPQLAKRSSGLPWFCHQHPLRSLPRSGELGNGTFAFAKIPVEVHLPAGDRATVIGAGPASSTAFVIATTS